MDYKYLEPAHANVLLVYDQVVKSTDTFILRMIIENYYDKFSPYMNLEPLRTCTIDAMIPLVVARTKKNPLEWLAKTEFDYASNYAHLHKRFVNMYDRAPILKHFQVMEKFCLSYCIGSVYVWSPEYDKRIHYDIEPVQSKYSSFQYVTGDMNKVINAIGNLNLIYDYDADRVYDLVKDGYHNDIFFALARYGFNYGEDHKLIHGLSDMGNVGTFYPHKLTTESVYYG
jgi:hypothetical protein